jgi:hypothetical protein
MKPRTARPPVEERSGPAKKGSGVSSVKGLARRSSTEADFGLACADPSPVSTCEVFRRTSYNNIRPDLLSPAYPNLQFELVSTV